MRAAPASPPLPLGEAPGVRDLPFTPQDSLGLPPPAETGDEPGSLPASPPLPPGEAPGVRDLSSPRSILLLTILAVLILIVSVALLVGAGTPALGAQPSQPSLPPALALAPLNTPAPQPTYLLASADATATPTPFQPLPPTAQLTPTDPVVQATLAPPPTFTPLPSPQATLPDVPLPEEQLIDQPPEQINILLLGSDRRPWDSGFRTDTIVLVTLNSKLGRVNVTSFPRDLYVTIPGYGQNRINTAWPSGGYQLLAQTFKHNFGVHPDFFVLIDFSSFKKIVDNLGGLTVNVAEPVSDYRAGYWVTIPAGPVEMDADMVLWYVRTRKTTSDIARNRRQQEVLMALFEKMLSLNAIRRAPEFYNLYKDSVTTDIGLGDILKWVPFAARLAQTRDIKQYYITYKQVYDTITPEGAMVLVPNQQAVMQIIRKSQNIK